MLSLALSTAFSYGLAPEKSLVHKPGKVAYEHIRVLSDEIEKRVAGTEGEASAKEYIYNQFNELGFETIIQDFTYGKSIKRHSSNVIAIKPGKSDEVVIVGAHYDAVSAGKGTDDNASGVGVMLEVAEVLKTIKTPYTIKFVAFGAEEVGLLGSKYYVSQMSQEDIDNTIAMINLDSLAVGDKMYVYGGSGEEGWIREQALNIAKKYKLNLETNPGINPHYPAGTTGLWSDHAPFAGKGIPYAYFESTNWELEDLDGYTQTEKDGAIWHTSKDTIQYIEENYPGRIQERLSTFSEVLRDLLKFMNKTSTARKVEITEEVITTVR
jgi:Zn-dependent M28 family amino/carboxypeptidase